jgi:methyl coenzyme M reductase subunit C
MHGGKTVFYRTGNVIREIHVPIIQMTISPVDAEDLTDIQ